MIANHLPFSIPTGPALRDLACDPDRLLALLDAAEDGEPAEETLVLASLACAEVLSRGLPAAAAFVEERGSETVLAVRYGPEDGEVLRFALPTAGLELGTLHGSHELALVLAVDCEAAADLEGSYGVLHGTTGLACVFPRALGVAASLCSTLTREVPAERWRELAAPARVHEARRGFAPRSGHPLESHQAGTLEGPPSRFSPGESMGDFTLRARLGRGSMGEVWRADGPEGQVAIKLALRPSFVRHLRQEGLLLAQVDHPHVARFVAADLEHDPPYLVTELVPGQPLRALCRGKLPTSNVVLLCDQLLSGLQAIHEAGILHLDLKPENVIVQPQGGLKIVDLGLGHATTRFMEEVYLSVSLVSRTPPVAGTLAYMSPEQRKGRDLKPQSDLFAFGILLHELLTGVLPEPGVGVSKRRPELPPRWDVVLARLTHPDPKERPRSADDARLLVSYTLSEKLRRPVPRGGVRPRDVRSFDEAAFALASPYVSGQVVGDGFELIQPLGRGGFGEVWRARRGGEEGRDEELVAVKLILSEDAREGLEQEAAVAARIQHPNVPTLLGNFSHEEPAHLVFELVEGRSLRLLIHERDEPFELGVALAIFAGQVEVVRACAEADVVHMDLKPEHFLVQHEERTIPKVTLIDFGLAALLERSGIHDSLASVDEVRGTLDYMAPEQRRGLTGPEVDVYALGVCLFELLTLSLPRGTQGIRSIRSRTPADLDELCLRMLANDHEARPSISEVDEELRAIRFQQSKIAAAQAGESDASELNPDADFGVLVGGMGGVAAFALLSLVVFVLAVGLRPEFTKSGLGGAEKAEVADVASGDLAGLIALLETPALASLARERARRNPSRALAEALARRLGRQRGHDEALGGALTDQGTHAFEALDSLRFRRPMLSASIYLRLAERGSTRTGALAGVAWILCDAPGAVREDLRGVNALVEDLRRKGLGVDPRGLRSVAGRLDQFLANPRGGSHEAQRSAAFLRACLGPRAGTGFRGLGQQLAKPWGREVVEEFAAQLPADASPAEKEAVARLSARLR